IATVIDASPVAIASSFSERIAILLRALLSQINQYKQRRPDRAYEVPVDRADLNRVGIFRVVPPAHREDCDDREPYHGRGHMRAMQSDQRVKRRAVSSARQLQSMRDQPHPFAALNREEGGAE